MSPTFTGYNTPNSTTGNIIDLSQFFVRKFLINIQRTNFYDLLFRQFGATMFFAMRDCFWMCLKKKSSFFRCVLHVLFCSSNPKMAIVYARRVIAIVKHIHIKRDRTICQFVCYPVCILLSIFYAKPSISLTYSASPKPTIIRIRSFFYMRPKTFFPMARAFFSLTNMTAILSLPQPNKGRRKMKDLSTLLANTCNRHLPSIKRNPPQAWQVVIEATCRLTLGGYNKKPAKLYPSPRCFHYTPSWGICQCL